MVLSWQSCTDHIYVVQSESSLTPTSSWADVAWMFGTDQQTSWMDTNAVGLAQEFYQVVRANPNTLNNGIPYGWAVSYGLDPFDPNLPWEDLTGDEQDNYFAYIAGTDPTNSSNYFHIVNILIVGSDVRVYFTSVSDRYYNLLRSEDPFGTYSNVVQNIPGNGGIQWAKDIGAASLGYYTYYEVSVFSTNLPPITGGDGIPDLWREQYFGHPTGLAADFSRATDNADGDCFNNWQEYQNGTDPTNSDPVVSVSGGTTICPGQTLTFSASTIPGATYSWTGPNGFSSTNQNPSSIYDVTTNYTGTYCVSATSSNCVSTNCISVTVYPPPTATVSGSTTVCPGVSASIHLTLTGTSPWTVTWSDGLITNYTVSSSGRTVTPSSTTNFTITALSDAICSGGTFSGSATVTVNTNGPTSSVVVSNEVLVVYNSNKNFPDSLTCANYYINNRPGFSDANVLGCNCTTTGTNGFESITTDNLTNQIINPIINFIQSNPTKSIHYVVLMYGMPSRVSDGPITYSPSGSFGLASVQHHISRCMSNAVYTSGQYYDESSTTCPFVTTNYPGTTCLVTALNMGTLTDCTAYIDKVASMYRSNVIISAKEAGYTNTNYYLDDTFDVSQDGGLAVGFKNQILAENLSTNVTYTSNTIIAAGSSVRGYAGWGVHNLVFANTYAVDGSVVWSGSSTWWIIETFESYNGTRDCGVSEGQPQGCVARWFASNAWGGANYTNTPVGAVSNVEEPYVPGLNGPTYMSLWEEGFLFSECAWASKNTPCFQAIGDPLVKQ
jgi:hypothetical protein